MDRFMGKLSVLCRIRCRTIYNVLMHSCPLKCCRCANSMACSQLSNLRNTYQELKHICLASRLQHPPQMMNRFDNFGVPEFSDPRARSSLHHGRQGHHFALQGSEFGIMRMGNGLMGGHGLDPSICPLKNLKTFQEYSMLPLT